MRARDRFYGRNATTTKQPLFPICGNLNSSLPRSLFLSIEPPSPLARSTLSYTPAGRLQVRSRR